MHFRPISLLLALVFVVSCGLVPTEIGRQLLPSNAPFRTANDAYNALLERHVDRPTSTMLLTAAVEAVDKYLKASGLAVPEVERPKFGNGSDADFKVLTEYLNASVDKNPGADKATAVLLERVATDGMARSMNECHTYYLDPERAKSFNAPPQEYSGIGATISATRPSEMAEISSVFPNSPAERAGVKAGDRIKRVDGTEVTGFTAEEIANRIRGPEGTTVLLVLVRAGADREFPIVRARLIAPRVISNIQDGDLGYISVGQLNGDVSRQVADAVQRLHGEGVKGWILDLRNNPGGDLSAAVDIASIFIPSGVLVYQIGRDGDRRALRTNDSRYFRNPKPLVVLVNERSASGAEIIASAARANGVGTVIGQKSAGCVGIGQPRQLPDGSLILITLARMQDAKTGAELNGADRGVVPDRVVAEPDAQIPAAIEYLRGQVGRR